MIEKIDEPVSVELIFNSTTRSVFPHLIRWRGRLYTIKTVGLHHRIKEGTTLLHVFSVSDGNLFFRLVLDTQNLHWKLTEVADASVN